MKHSFLLIAISLLLFSACNQDKDKYAELAIGKWVNTQVNYKPILTDASFFMNFRSDMVQLYAIGFQLDINNKTWKENDDYVYSIDENIISIDGFDVLDNFYHMEFEISSLNQTTLIYSIKAFLINGTEYPNENIYTCKRVTDDFSEQFVGLWYGKCTSAGTADTKDHYWEYFADGSFNYYYMDNNDHWIKKSDNDGGYFLYGNLFVSNYTNDLLSGGTGKAFECWNFSIEGSKMTWTGIRENDKIVTYEMNKVQNAPITGN